MPPDHTTGARAARNRGAGTWKRARPAGCIDAEHAVTESCETPSYVLKLWVLWLYPLQACLDVGMDEVIALPEVAELEQVDRLAEVANKITGLEATPRNHAGHAPISG